MSERLWIMPKIVVFDELSRKQIALGTGVRLDPYSNSVKLVGSYGTFPTDVNPARNFLSPIINPDAARNWLSFQSDQCVKKDADGNEQGGLAFRIHDPTGNVDWWWNGAAWATIATSGTSFNTEADMAAHISTFWAAAHLRKIRIRIRLASTSPYYTPESKGVRLVYGALYESIHEDLLYRTLVPALKSQLRPSMAMHCDGSGTTSLDLGSILVDSSMDHLDVVDVSSVYNHTDDPTHVTNLFSSYDVGSKTITLTASIGSGKKAYITAVYAPEIVVRSTDQDYMEIEHVPAIIVHDLKSSQSTDLPAMTSVVNKAAGTLYAFPNVRIGKISFTIDCLASLKIDLERLTEAVNDFLVSNQIMRMIGIDEAFEVWLDEGYQDGSYAGSEGVSTSFIRGEFRRVIHPSRRVLTSANDGIYPILRLHAIGDTSLTYP